MANVSWKRALLPSLGSRHKDDRSATRPPSLLASNTVPDIHTTSSAQATNDGVASSHGALDDVDDNLVSDLLETTTETNFNYGNSTSISTFGHPAQIRQFTHSRTMGAMPPTDALDPAPSPYKSQDTGVHTPNIPHKSSRRNLRKTAREIAAISPAGATQDGLVRPLPTSQSLSSHFTSLGTRRIPQHASSVVGKTGSLRYKGDSPIRKGSSSPRKISHSVTSVLVSSPDYTRATADPTNIGGPLKSSRSKTKNVFAKFADVLTEHFGTKGSRKGDRSGGPVEAATTSRVTATQPNIPDQTLTKLQLNPLPLPVQDITELRPTSLAGDDHIEKRAAETITRRAKAGLSSARKRLTIVDEVDFQNGQPLEDPFSENSSGQQSTHFEARLKSKHGVQGEPTSSDPFLAERILETSLDAILATPPIGCSTPRHRPLYSSRCETPTHGSHNPDHVADLITFSPDVPAAHQEQRSMVPTLRGTQRKENQSLEDSRKCGFAGIKNSRPKTLTSSDSTRLSSYPPGSTIRHVPRSMGRLTEARTLSVSDVARTRPLPLGRKKHPSPSKGQLELFGKYMDKNLALGVFKDSDELGMSFNSPHPALQTLSPRDSNQLMRSTAVSNIDSWAEYTAHDKRTTLPKPPSRIPQPVRQLSRSRTDTAFARDFIPANKGDSTMGDELQWDVSAYKIGKRFNHCGSTNEIV